MVELYQANEKKGGHTPAGMVHSSLLYDNDFTGETSGSREVRTVVIRSDSLTTATFLVQVLESLLACTADGDRNMNTRNASRLGAFHAYQILLLL